MCLTKLSSSFFAVSCLTMTLTVASLAAADPIPSPVRIGTTGDSAATRVVSFDELSSKSVVIKFENHASGPLELYSLKGTTADRVNPCVLTGTNASTLTLDWSKELSPICRSVLAPLESGSETKLALSEPGKIAYAILSYTPPPAYKGAAVAFSVDIPAGGLSSFRALPIPAAVSVVDNDCYVLLDQPRKTSCAQQKLQPDDHLGPAIAAKLSAGDPVSLVMKVRDATTVDGDWRTFSITPKTPAPTSPDPPASQRPAAPLRQRCLSLALSESWDHDGYLVCVDAFKEQRGLVTLACPKGGGCTEVGEVVRVNRDFRILVWRDSGLPAAITLAGTPGTTSLIYVQSDLGGANKANAERAAEDRNLPKDRGFFGPRRSGAAKLTVLAQREKPAKEGEEPTLVTVASVEHTFGVETYYRSAVRLGLGFTWLPTAERVGVRTTSDGQRYTAVVEGQDHGLFAVELTAGWSWLTCDMGENEFKLCAGLGARLGMLSFDSDSPKPLSSFMLGAEAAIGVDLALGIFGGIARHDAPDAGYEAGRRLAPTDEIKTHLAIVPAVGIVANFTPGFLKAAGIVQ